MSSCISQLSLRASQLVEQLSSSRGQKQLDEKMGSSRGLKWTTEQTKVLAELKSSGLKWQAIATTISKQFPEEAKKGVQCQRRWETLKKVYESFEAYCRNTGRAHTDLTKEEIDSLNKATKATAYEKEWYSIVKEFYDPPPQAGMASEPSYTRSVSDPLQVRSPPRNIQHSASTSGESSEQVETSIVPRSVERESASHFQQYGAADIAGMGFNQSETFGVSRLEPWTTTESNGLRSYEQISAASDISEQLRELTDDEKWADSLIVTPPESEKDSDEEIEHETEQEIEPVQTNIVPMSVDRSSPSLMQQFGAPNVAGAMGPNQQQASFSPFESPPWGPDDANQMMYMFQISRASSISTVMKAEVCVQSSEFIPETDSDSDLLFVSRSQGVGH